MPNKIKGNNLKVIVIILLMAISISALGFSFGWITLNQKIITPNYLSVSDISFGLTDSVNNISLGQVVPVLDKFGITNNSFSFSITNSGDADKNYHVRLIDGGTISTIDNTNIRYQITKNDEVVGILSLNGSGVIDSGILSSGESVTYSLKVWLDYESTQINGSWSKIVSVEAGSVNLDNSGANMPIITNNMIPIYFDETDKVWKKADSNNQDIRYRWYDYNGQIWANAVTVSANTRISYLSAPNGTVIKNDDINTMWVWIPRYKYTIFNSEGKSIDPVGIDITFEQGILKTGSVTCKNEFNTSTKTSEICVDPTNTIKDNVSTYTHPAFTFGNQELTGFWMSKFEASANPSSICYTSTSNSNCNVPNLDIYVRPGAKSLSNISMANMQASFRRMELENNIYGFVGNGSAVNSDGSITDDNNNIDTHMIKNMEWGAVAYLYHSKYGKYGNCDYAEGDKEIYKNNSVDTYSYTGTSAGTGTTNGMSGTMNYPYDTSELGTGASTTGNIYGIYDMNGGRSEFVMTNAQTTLGTFIPGNTGFTSLYPLNKYYEPYYSYSESYSIYKLGDATKETKMWYSDGVRGNTNNNVFLRGGQSNNDGIGTNGIFSLNYYNPNNRGNGSRPVLVISNDIYVEW